MSESNPEVLKAVRLLVGDLVNKERYVMLPAEPGEGDPVLGKFRTVSDANRFASRSDITEFSLWTRLKVVGGGSLKEDFKDSDDEEEIDDDLEQSFNQNKRIVFVLVGVLFFLMFIISPIVSNVEVGTLRHSQVKLSGLLLPVLFCVFAFIKNKIANYIFACFMLFQFLDQILSAT